MRIIFSIFLSLIALNTSFNLFGPGTCSFDGSAGGRVITVQRFVDNSGAVSCNFAAFIILLIVLGYWGYFYKLYLDNSKLYESRRLIKKNKTTNEDILKNYLKPDTKNKPKIENYFPEINTNKVDKDKRLEKLKLERDKIDDEIKNIENVISTSKQYGNPNRISFQNKQPVDRFLKDINKELSKIENRLIEISKDYIYYINLVDSGTPSDVFIMKGKFRDLVIELNDIIDILNSDEYNNSSIQEIDESNQKKINSLIRSAEDLKEDLKR
tara:strand:- start:169 stop:975 length:807 start_codon:yes stop_codon:yes gene_type:complete